MIIGKLTTAKGNLAGKIDILSATRKVVFTPNTKGADFTITTDSGAEIGAAWKRTSKDGKKDFLSVKLDSPFLTAPINCALFEQIDGSHALVWERPERKLD